MGVFQDVITNAGSFAASQPVGRYLQSRINSQVDPALPTEAAEANAVHTMATATQTSGNMTLTVTLRSGEAFTTGSLAFNAAASAVETAIDLAATAASITGWTNGDISVSGGAVNANPVILTFDGTSVAGANHDITVLADVDGAGGAWGAIVQTTPGQTIRYALGALIALSILSAGTIANQSAVASTSGFAIGSTDRYGKFPQTVLRDLAREMAFEDDNNDSYHTVMASLAILDRAPEAERLGTSSIV